jgi:hypothetical protein
MQLDLIKDSSPASILQNAVCQSAGRAESEKPVWHAASRSICLRSRTAKPRMDGMLHMSMSAFPR